MAEKGSTTTKTTTKTETEAPKARFTNAAPGIKIKGKEEPKENTHEKKPNWASSENFSNKGWGVS